MNIHFNIPEIMFMIDLVTVLKLALATGIGLVIGKERKNQDKSGGSRTMAMISLGACLLSIISLKLYDLKYTFDFIRLIAYNLPAIGFIGMGIIHKTKNGVDGLTTAATLMVLATVGFCIGLGFYFCGILTSILIYILLESKYWKKV